MQDLHGAPRATVRSMACRVFERDPQAGRVVSKVSVFIVAMMLGGEHPAHRPTADFRAQRSGLMLSSFSYNDEGCC